MKTASAVLASYSLGFCSAACAAFDIRPEEPLVSFGNAHQCQDYGFVDRKLCQSSRIAAPDCQAIKNAHDRHTCMLGTRQTSLPDKAPQKQLRPTER